MSIPPPSIVAALPITLPEEFICEVLSLLTVKSLMRMKCVNKIWNTLISDPIFVKMHLRLSPRNTHLVIKSFCSRSANIIPVSMSDLLKIWERTITIKLTNDPYCQFHSKDLSRIVGSCNGLICLLDLNYMNSDYIERSLYFWNPATRRKSEKLGSICINHNPNTFIGVQFAFGYDNSTDTYKVVSLNLGREGELVRTTVKVFTLGDNVWRDIDCFPVVLMYFPDCLVQHDGVFFGNSINWWVYREYNCHSKNVRIKEYIIVSLDLGTETYSQLLLPRCCNENPLSPTPTTLSVFMDCLCFSHDFEKTYYVIWQMKEFGVEESWTQLLKISYGDLQIKYWNLLQLCFSDDALIFFTFGKTTLYDWRNNIVKKIRITNFEDKILYHWYNTKNYYVESLVSTC